MSGIEILKSPGKILVSPLGPLGLAIIGLVAWHKKESLETNDSHLQAFFINTTLHSTFSSTCIKTHIPPSTDHIQVSDQYRIRSLLLALARYHKDHSLIQNLQLTIFVLRQLHLAHCHTKAIQKIYLLLLLRSPLTAQVSNILQQTCFISLLRLPALGLQDVSLQVASQTEGGFKNATQLQPG